MKRWKMDTEGNKAAYFLRDTTSEKCWWYGKLVFSLIYDMIIKSDYIFKSYPESERPINFGFEI